MYKKILIINVFAFMFFSLCFFHLSLYSTVLIRNLPATRNNPQTAVNKKNSNKPSEI